MLDRRRFLGAVAYPALATAAVLRPGRAPAVADDLAKDSRSPAESAADEHFWSEVQQAFTVDRSLVNLNNGGVSPSPAAHLPPGDRRCSQGGAPRLST